jgi:hypothetical protein
MDVVVPRLGPMSDPGQPLEPSAAGRTSRKTLRFTARGRRNGVGPILALIISGCSGTTGSPQIIYVTPPPASAAPSVAPTASPSAEPTPLLTPTPPAPTAPNFGSRADLQAVLEGGGYSFSGSVGTLNRTSIQLRGDPIQEIVIEVNTFASPLDDMTEFQTEFTDFPLAIKTIVETERLDQGVMSFVVDQYTSPIVDGTRLRVDRQFDDCTVVLGWDPQALKATAILTPLP